MLRQRIEYIALGAFLTPFVPARSIRSARQVNSDGNSYMDFRTYRTAMHFALTPLPAETSAVARRHCRLRAFHAKLTIDTVLGTIALVVIVPMGMSRALRHRICPTATNWRGRSINSRERTQGLAHPKEPIWVLWPATLLRANAES